MSALDNELLKRIFGHVGAIAGPNFGKTGIVSPDYLSKTIALQSDLGKVTNYSVWIGQLKTDENYRLAITNIGSLEKPEFIMILTIGDAENSPITGFSLQYFDDQLIGNFMQLINNKWLPISTLHKLNLTIAFELITQNGILWLPLKEETEKLYNNLTLLVSQILEN